MKKKNGEEMAGPTVSEVGEGVQKELKKLIVGKKDGGLMEAIRKVDAEKGMMDGGEVDMSRGQAGYDFKGIF